jgi:hypothetical protein
MAPGLLNQRPNLATFWENVIRSCQAFCQLF